MHSHFYNYSFLSNPSSFSTSQNLHSSIYWFTHPSRNLCKPWQNARILSLPVTGVWKASCVVNVVPQTVASNHSVGLNKWVDIWNQTVACVASQIDPLARMDHCLTELKITIKQPSLPLSSGAAVPDDQPNLSCSVAMTMWQLPQATLILRGTWDLGEGAWRYKEGICLVSC